MEFYTAWLETIAARDQYYLMVFLLVGTTIFWYRWQFRRLKNLFKLGAMLAVVAGLAWGASLLWV